MDYPLLFSLDTLGPFGPAPHIAVAVSGGADSMALTLLAADWAAARGGHITALTVDHGLRAESAAEAAHVGRWLQAHGIAHVTLTPAFTGGSNNLQENARHRRYDALAAWCRAHDVLHCLLAHHAGDQRETVALMQARGDTADGAAGMAQLRNYAGVRFLRPLLGTEKHALTRWLKSRGVAWIEDPSNQSRAFARVRMRQQLQEDAPQQAALSQRAAQQGAARHARDMALAEAAMEVVTLHPLGFAEVALKAWRMLAPALATQLMADLLTTLSGQTHRPRGHETARLCAALHAPFTRATLHGCDLTLRVSTLRVARELARCEAPVMLSGAGHLHWDARFRVQYALPAGVSLRLGALGVAGVAQPQAKMLPPSTPALSHLDAPAFVPYMQGGEHLLPEGALVQVGFAPAKPLAAAAFWCLN